MIVLYARCMLVTISNVKQVYYKLFTNMIAFSNNLNNYAIAHSLGTIRWMSIISVQLFLIVINMYMLFTSFSIIQLRITNIVKNYPVNTIIF